MNLIERILCFRVETIDGSAVGGEDFVTFNQVIQFEANEVEKQVSSKRKIYCIDKTIMHFNVYKNSDNDGDSG